MWMYLADGGGALNSLHRVVATAGHRVIGTAGHVDHGKTALVRALTGVDCDRLEEEKRRGITITLGFAAWDLGDMHVSVVDVPGHERFVHTMVAGAGGLDAVLLVVAADDGVMPQTREHLQICQLLGVERGLVIISKCDLADAETLELIREDVRDGVAGTFLAGAPVIPCSATTGEGIEAVKAAVAELLAGVEQRTLAGPAFLPIDRVFSKTGFGTVVTGTLLSGLLRTGDLVEVLPGHRGQIRKGLRVRGLQVHGMAVDEAGAGVRLAVNLRGQGCEEVVRGELLATAGAQLPTGALHAEVGLLPEAPILERSARLSLHIGTAVELVDCYPLGQQRVAPGTVALIRLVAERPLAVFAGQRLVLRQPGRHGMGTVGGGRLLDPHPAVGKGSFQRWFKVAQALGGGDEGARVAALLTDVREAGASAQELWRRLPPSLDVREALERLVTEGEAVVADAGGETRYVSVGTVAEVAERVRQLVAGFHRERPVLAGMAPAELISRLPVVSSWLAEVAVDHLVAQGALERVDHLLRLPGHSMTGAGSVLDSIGDDYLRAGFTPPLDGEMRSAHRLDGARFRDVFTELKRQGILVRIGEQLHYHRQVLDALVEKVAGHFNKEPELTPATMKELVGVSRKFAIPLLEWLDAEGVTVRRGNVRVARMLPGERS